MTLDYVVNGLLGCAVIIYLVAVLLFAEKL